MGNSALQRRLMYFWDLVDISENLKRAKITARSHGNGMEAWLNCAAMLVLTCIAMMLAWKFDIESTLIGLSTLRETVLSGLPASVLKFSTYLVIALSVAPTVIELFTSAYAKADIKIIQLIIIVFTAFDMITDIPRAMTFTNQLQANFDQLGILSPIVYWAFFLFWLFLSTIGFELVTVIFGFLTVVYCFKGMADDTRISKGFGNKGLGKGSMPTVSVEAASGERVKID